MKIKLVFFLLLISSLPAVSQVCTEVFPSQTLQQPEAHRFNEGLKDFQAYQAEKSQIVRDPADLPFALHHGQPTSHVALVIHGAYQTPRQQAKVTREFFDRGFNVITILLPGHGENAPPRPHTDFAGLWRKETDRGLAMAEKLGTNIVIAGFSAGGLLAVDSALRHPAKIKGLVLWAPALSVRAPVSISASFFDSLGLPVQPILGPKVDPAYAWQLTCLARNMCFDFGSDSIFRNLSASAAYKKIAVPVFVTSSNHDEIINHAEVESFIRNVRGPKETVFFSGLFAPNHSGISSYLEGKVSDQGSDGMWNRLHGFLDRRFGAKN